MPFSTDTNGSALGNGILVISGGGKMISRSELISLEILVWVDPSRLIPKYASMLRIFIVAVDVGVELELESDMMEAGELGNRLDCTVQLTRLK